MSRPCDAIGCGAYVATGRFMCIKHWRMVPLDLQRTINTRYRACRKDFGFLSDLRYLRAAVDAVEAIARAEGFVADGAHPSNPYVRHLVLAQKRAHTASRDCWCEPEVNYTDPETGASVVVHRGAQ